MDVLRTEFHVVAFDPTTNVIRLTRNSRPLGDGPSVEAEYTGINSFLDRFGRKDRGLLIDIRDAPGRNDPAFEDIMRRQRLALFKGFRRVGILMKSAVGILQVKRHMRETNAEPLVSNDEAELLAHVQSRSAG